MLNRTMRERLLASTIIAGALIAAPALAQDATTAGAPQATQTGDSGVPSGPQTAASAGPAQPTANGEIVVTGSLIKNPSLTSVTPVTVIGQEELQLRQVNTATDFLSNLPGAVADVGSAVNNGNGGFSFANLRGLGSNRNVVLLDGNRLVPAELAGRTDLNNIPLALIQRTDILTGGASTTYGADAISGVINFITRSDFTGVEAQVSKQITGQGDGAYYRADLTVGGNFDDGKGNAVISIGYQHEDPVYQGDRAISRAAISPIDGTATGSGTSVPSRFGGITGLGTRQINPATGALNGTTAYIPFNFNPYNVFQVPFERFNIYGAGHYDISDDLTFYTRGIYSKNTVNTIIAPSGAFALSVVIPYSNPYLPAAAATQIGTANGLTAAQIAAARANLTPGSTTNANGTFNNLNFFRTTLSRRASEAGPRQSNYSNNFFDYRAGIRGNINSHLHFDINGSYGESSQLTTVSGYTLNSRFRDALLATNTSTCLSGNAGCVPVNVFGANGSITPAMLAYLQADSFQTTRTSLGQARGVLTGDFGFNSPLATDPIQFAAGVEYRNYRASQNADSLSRAEPSDLGGAGAPFQQINGGYQVTEGFGELVAPLVQDKPLLQSLELNAGIRYSHYQIATDPSRSFNTTTWKAGGTWKVVDMLTVRGTYSKAVRAPNIGELFQPAIVGLTSLNVDPCAGRNPVGNANLTAVCIAQGAPASAIGLIDAPSAGQVNATSGGNINLRPEKSDSYTAGIVLQPKRFVPGLALTVDYYHIRITNEISSSTTGDVINQCFGSSTGTGVGAGAANSAACTSIRRDPNTGALSGDNVGGIPLFITNQGRALTDGIDLGANYRRDLGVGILNLSFNGNWTHRSDFQPTPVSTVFRCVGAFGSDCASIQPKFSWQQRTTFTYHDVDFSVLWRHYSKSVYEDAGVKSPEELFSNFGTIPAYNYLDLSTRIGAGDHVEFTITVQNLLNKKPPLVGNSIGSTAFNSGNTYPSTYDALGRRFGVSARVKF